MNVHIGIVDEHTRLHIPGSIDVEIVSASGNTAANILCIVLEIHAENRLCVPKSTDTFVNDFSLLRRGQKCWYSFIANGHIVEEPDKHSPHVNHHVEKLFAADVGIVRAGIAG